MADDLFDFGRDRAAGCSLSSNIYTTNNSLKEIGAVQRLDPQLGFQPRHGFGHLPSPVARFACENRETEDRLSNLPVAD